MLLKLFFSFSHLFFLFLFFKKLFILFSKIILKKKKFCAKKYFFKNVCASLSTYFYKKLLWIVLIEMIIHEAQQQERSNAVVEFISEYNFCNTYLYAKEKSSKEDNKEEDCKKENRKEKDNKENQQEVVILFH